MKRIKNGSVNNIYLIGMMGSGKTATAKVLAKLLNCKVSSFDAAIRDRNEGKTVTEIFELYGEPFFRDQESAVLRETPGSEFLVADTGGGIVVRRENIDQMKFKGKVVYLETSLDVLWQRVKRDKQRPLLHTENPKETLKTILEVRSPLYEKACDFKVNTDNKTVGEVARIIAEKLGQKP